MKPKYLPEPLPDAEWDFSRYKDEGEISRAFYYEYCRSCVEIHPWIVGARRFWGSTVPVPPEQALNMEADAFFAEASSLPAFPFFEFLSAIPDFPKKPLSECDLSRAQWFYEASTSAEGIVTYHKDCLSEPGTLEGLQQVSEDCFKDPFRGPIGFGEAALVFLSLNWGRTDTELQEDFREFLKRNRPKRFKSLTHSPKGGIGNVVLPFKKNTALDWLGVWRRRQKVTWPKYMSVYFPESDKSAYSRRAQLEREEKKKCASAQKVLNWFAGVPDALKGL